MAGSEPTIGNECPVLLPDFDLPSVRQFVSAWHATVGQRVVAGDRLLEITAGDVTIDLPVPTSGVLIQRCVATDDPLQVGQLLARIQSG